MALEIVDLLAKRLKQEYGLKFESCATKNLKFPVVTLAEAKTLNTLLNKS